MHESALFEVGDPAEKPAQEARVEQRREPRIRRADRRQVRLLPTSLDALLPYDHQARAVWAFVERLTLDKLYEPIESVEGRAGRPSTDPQILLALWLFATIDGVGSARAVERLCSEHVAYRWICGGVNRIMKMADGGFRPAFNVQFASDTATQLIAGVDVTNTGSDLGELPPMIEQIKDRYGVTPEEALVDGGYVRLADIEALAAEPHNCRVYAPVPVHKKSTLSPHEPRPKDGPAVAEWRERMGTDEAKAIYKQRGASIECVNAIMRNRGLRQFLVRGLKAVKSVALIYALAHNLVRTIALAA